MKYDVVIIGGGLAGLTAGMEIIRAGKSCAIVSEGLSLHKDLPRKEFSSLGGTFFPGDSVTAGNWDGIVLKSVVTRNLAPSVLEADNFILATGKFFSKGLVSTMDTIVEPVFGSDVEFDADRTKWCSEDFFAPQPFENFGVKTDEDGKVYVDGNVSSNLYAAGEIVAGCNSTIADAEKKIREMAISVASKITRN